MPKQNHKFTRGPDEERKYAQPRGAQPRGEQPRGEQLRERSVRPELFSVPRMGNLLNPKERRTGEERALVGKYLELADIAFNSAIGEDSVFDHSESHASNSDNSPYLFSRKGRAA